MQAIGAPVIFMFLLFILQQSDYANQSLSVKYPPVNALQGVYQCKAPVPCISILFTPPDDPFFTSVLTTFAAKNAKRTGESVMTISDPITDTSIRPATDLGLVPVVDNNFIYDYVSQNANTTSWALSFSKYTDSSGITNVQYQAWYNVSNTANGIDVFGQQLQALMRGVDEAIITVLNDPTATVTANLDVNLRNWPTVAPVKLSDTVVQQLGPVFFFCCVMVIFINSISQILTEKENYLRHGMEVMGLKPSIYWISEFFSNMVLVIIGSIITICLGLAFGFVAFRKTSFLVLFFTFFLFGQSMVSFAFFLSTFFRKVQTGVFVGIFVFMVGLIFESFIFSSGYIGYLWWKATTPIAITNLLSLLPFFNFGAMFLNISTLTTGQYDQITNQYIPGNEFSWSDLYIPIPTNLLPTYTDSTNPVVPAPINIFYWFILNILLYSVLTWYLDRALPNEYGVRDPLWFFLTPSYWGFHPFLSKNNKTEWLDSLKNPKSVWGTANEHQFPLNSSRLFSDVDVERERAKALSEDDWSSIKVVHLRKEYKDWMGNVTKIAIHDSCVTFEEGKVFALLGQNGAGKSTTLNILSGLSSATYGDAMVYGYSLKTQIHQIRAMMGICPQHNILFNELTASEHIELYAGLKGVSEKDWAAIVEERLGAVKLLKVANDPVASFSGGMKRRLSVVIATIGDPKIVFLDEPTTGMDPINRRYVWSFIEKFKKDRVIILTTHSMEEADVLGDRIAIMAHGKIRAYGDTTSLKTKFGTGYKLSIISDPHKLAKTKDIVGQTIPGCTLEDDSAGALLYQFPNSSISYVSALIKIMNATPIFKSWGISQTTLEQVFLAVVRAADTEKMALIEHDGSGSGLIDSASLR